MIQGTASDVGKSIVTAAFCRIFMQDGLRTAPFKSQNMSNNSYVTWDGKEIGRAQGMQADACGIMATTDMNPILLKPKKDMMSQVVVHGVPLRDYDARAYREQYLSEAEAIVKEAVGRLRDAYDIVVLEGAGSPAEINLKDRDIVNMRMAGWADAPVLLVADIDRGGVFASIVGTLELLEPHERDRVAGFIINKFRGDVTLLQPGIDWLEKRTGKPVFGVIPYLDQLGLEDEDSLSLGGGFSKSRSSDGATGNGTAVGRQARKLDIAVIRFPRISNFTDFDPLMFEDDVTLRYITSRGEFGTPDAVLLPGSKNTMDDLAFLRQSGLAEEIMSYTGSGGFMTGLCAGYEMMGRRLLDPLHVESDVDETRGLALFPFDIRFVANKRTVRVAGEAALPGDSAAFPVEGYEIHMGVLESADDYCRPFLISPQLAGDHRKDSGSRSEEGASSPDGRIWGTFIHGVLHNDEFRRSWLNRIRKAKGMKPLPVQLRFKQRREEAFDRLAAHMRSHLDMERIYRLLRLGKGERS
jgi:adenosylcobyric acid synthase